MAFNLFHKSRLVPGGFLSRPICDSRPFSYRSSMQAPEIVNFTVMATVGIAFLQQQMTDDTARRVSQFEEIIGACVAVLQHIGRPRYLDSVFQLWSGVTHSLILMETMLFPEQQVQTSSQLVLPQENMPLSHILDDAFQPMAYRIPLALQALADYTNWFHDKYDVQLHREMAAVLDDAMLIFQTIHQILQLRPGATNAAQPAPDTGGPGTTAVVLPDQVTPPDPWNP